MCSKEPHRYRFMQKRLNIICCANLGPAVTALPGPAPMALSQLDRAKNSLELIASVSALAFVSVPAPASLYVCI